jgi:glycosyltransferase involved in cell wall biosynthesis
MNKTAIIIPVYNCGQTIAPLIEQIMHLALPCDIVVVNDGSTDDTTEVLRRQPVRLISHVHNKGKGAALHSGITWAREKGYNFALTMDGDGQHDPKDIEKFLARKADLAIGRREFKIGKMPLTRIFSNSISSRILSRAAGKVIHDSQCGFRKVRLAALEGFSPRSRGYQYETEIILYIARVKRGRIVNVPVNTVYNRSKSYIRHIPDTWEFITAVWRYTWISE